MMVYDPRQDERYNKDAVFQALLNQESQFNPNAVSPTGARGYAQLLESTTRDPGFGIKPNPSALLDPEQNVAFGYDYLNAMRKRYKGDDSAALVAYNGGPGKADEWVASGKNDKVLSGETRGYYKKILGSTGQDFSKINAGYMGADKPKLKESTKLDEISTQSTTLPEPAVKEKSVKAVSSPRIKQAVSKIPTMHDEASKGGSSKPSLSSFSNTFQYRPQQMASDLDNPLER